MISRLEAATRESEVLAVIREIEEVKTQTEIRLLEIQADFARQEGNSEKDVSTSWGSERRLSSGLG